MRFDCYYIINLDKKTKFKLSKYDQRLFIDWCIRVSILKNSVLVSSTKKALHHTWSKAFQRNRDRGGIGYPFHDRMPKAKSKPENGFAFLSEFISLEQVQLISSNKKVAQPKSCATLL